MLRLHRRLKVLTLIFLLSLGLTLGQMVSSSAKASHNESTRLSAFQDQARDYYSAGQYDAAIAIWEQSAQHFVAQGDILNQAGVLSNLALAYQQVALGEKAQSTMAQSLKLLERWGSVESASTARIVAQVWHSQGNLALMRSQPTEALNAFEIATDYYQQAHHASGILRSQVNQARALQALGFYRRAITQLQGLGLPDQSHSLTQVTGLQLLGDLQRATGDLVAAQQTLETALTNAQSLGMATTIAKLQLSLGHTAQARGDSTLALDSYKLAAAVPQLQLRVQALLSQWSLLMTLADTPQADRLYHQINTLLTTVPVGRLTVNAYLDLARHQLDQEISPQRINAVLGIAQQQALALEDQRAQSYALGYLGELRQQQGRGRDANHFLRQALTLAEQINAPDLAYQWYWHLGQLQQQRGSTLQAIDSYGQAVNNLQSLRNNLVAIAPDLRFDFREQVEPVYREWVNLLLTIAKRPSPDQQNQLIKARQAIESLQLAELENFFREPCVPITQEIDQVIENTDAPTAVIYPIILPDRLEIILKLPGQPLQQYTTQVSQPKLERLLSQIQRDFQRPPFTEKRLQRQSAQLYDWLIRPMASDLSDHHIDTLVFVLDGALRNIPMAVLYNGQQYLVENYAIALAPGLQLIDPKPLQQQEFATVIAGLSQSRHGFTELPFVKDEVDQIQGSTPSRVLFNESFTAANLAATINNTSFPIVHLATHGQFSSDPDQTFVLAWDQPIAMDNLNSLLRQGEQIRQNAIELLILSACETATGDKRAALGLAGVAVQAGVRSTLASLWNLDDQSGAIFASLFYGELQTPNISKAQALRHAQLKLMRDYQAPNPIFQHPRYWAPYVLLGNWL